METVVTRVSLDITKSGSQVLVPMFQGDTNRTLEFKFTEGGKPYNLTDCSVAFTGEKADGTFLNNLCDVDFEKQIATYDVGKDENTRQTTACKGYVRCQLIVYKQTIEDGETNTKRVASPYFNIVVMDNIYNDEDIIKSESTFGVLEKLYVPLIRSIADLELSSDITAKDMQAALNTYPVIIDSDPPSKSLKGENGQLYYDIEASTLYMCRGYANGYMWYLIGTTGLDGADGADGASAYEIAVDNGFEGTEAQWLESLIGQDGKDGEDGSDGTSVTVSSVTESTEDGGNNTVVFSDGTSLNVKNGTKGEQGEKGEKGDTGAQGAQGEKGDTGAQGPQGEKGDKGDDGQDGEDGYTPVKGTDYWTDSDKAEMVEYVTEALSSSTQPAYTNQLDTAGYSTDTRLNSSGTTTTAEGMEATGFIPFVRGDVIRLKNIGLLPSGDYKSQQYFVTYDSDKTKLVAHISNVFSGAYAENDGIELDEDGNLILIKTDALSTDNSYAVPETAAYFRLSAESITDESIITVNEEIKDSTSIEVGVVDYVTTEADEVIDKVLSNLGTNTFVFAAITDMHYGNSSNTDGVKHACQALSHISSRIKLDALAVLGDYTDSLGTTNESETLSDMQTVNSLLADIPFVTPIRVMGNHDFITQDSPIIARYINAYNDGVEWGSKSGGYFYRDFDDYKLRIIVVNTTETSGSGLYVSSDQYNWFANALDLSAKSNASEWQTLILSHMPLDWFAPDGYVFHGILKAYLNGTSYSNGDVTCDFSGKNSAQLIANIHGHIHNLLVREIADGQPNATEDTVAVKRIATPEACVGRENSYNGTWDYNPFGEETSYPKTVNTAEDTAFCVYLIDLDTKTIQAICYGAGYDRTISY